MHLAAMAFLLLPCQNVYAEESKGTSLASCTQHVPKNLNCRVIIIIKNHKIANVIHTNIEGESLLPSGWDSKLAA